MTARWSPAHESPCDYSVDLASGIITRNPTGFILNGQQTEVDYVWNNGGNAVWTEGQAVGVNGGLYHVMLGAVIRHVAYWIHQRHMLPHRDLWGLVRGQPPRPGHRHRVPLVEGDR